MPSTRFHSRRATALPALLCLLQFLCCMLQGIAPPPSAAAATRAQKVVIPFDLQSTFDEGRYGQMLGESIWKALSREKRFTIPESMLDVRDYCSAHKFRPTPQTELKTIEQAVRQGFDAQIAIWGSIERSSGTEHDVYDLTIKCYDFSSSPPKKLYETTAPTKSVSDIPHLYVKQLLVALNESAGAGQRSPQGTAKEPLRHDDSLVTGDFERGADGVPKGWDTTAGQQRQPLGDLVQWTTERGNPNNRVIRFTLDRTTAENEGLMYYSDFFPVEEGATYRFQCRWRSDGPTVKVFVKCYDHVSKSSARREVYRSQQNLKGADHQWNAQAENFTPRHTKYAPQWARVMLYAYLKPGTVEFDDVVVKQITAAPVDAPAKKIRRPSSPSPVTSEQMEAERHHQQPRQ